MNALGNTVDNNKYLWEILVPTEMVNPDTNQLVNIRTRYHRVWDAKVRGLAGGLTIMHSNVAGEWTSDTGTVFRERMIPVRVMCDEVAMEQIARMTIEHYNQEAVMYYRISDRVVIFK